MSRSASLFGLCGLIALGFGIVAGLLTRNFFDPIVLVNGVAGVGLLLAYLAFGFENLTGLLGQRSTRYGMMAAVYSLVFLALVVGLNYLGTRYHKRWDVTEAGVHTLAPQSSKLVASLTDTLAMTAFVEGGVAPELESLLDSYRYAAGGKVTTRLLDPDKEPALADQMKITTVPSVHLQYGEESFVVTQPSESTITNGIIRVARSTKKTVYLAQGFGQGGFDDQRDPRGYSAIKLALEQENYAVKPLVWPAVDRIPDDASALVIAGIGDPPTDQAYTVLEDYLKGGGHVLLLVGPRTGDERLTALLERWGVKLGNDIVIDQEVRLFEGPKLGVQPLSQDYGKHPITENFRGYSVFPQARTVEPATTGKKGLEAMQLVRTSPSSWAETDVEAVFTQGVAELGPDDKRGPVSLALAVTAKPAEMGVASGDDAGKAEARLVVIGSTMFAWNQFFAQRAVNADLVLNAIGWLVGQDETVSIRTRTVRASRAELTANDSVRVFYLSVLIIPELLILFGVAVWWRRRSR
ncbi:MAG TPA: Gldg family protein [Candidatus Limnocylindria bacterium]|nr:Gldg family protein [Candidatus Limnocylindria bacterium]